MARHVDRGEAFACLVHRGSRIEESLQGIAATIQQSDVDRGALKDVVALVEVGRDGTTLNARGQELFHRLEIAAL